MANSPSQEEIAKSGPAMGSHNMTQAEREQAAMMLWSDEKGLATAVIVLGWLAKVRPTRSHKHCPTQDRRSSSTSPLSSTRMLSISGRALTAPFPVHGRPQRSRRHLSVSLKTMTMRSRTSTASRCAPPPTGTRGNHHTGPRLRSRALLTSSPHRRPDAHGARRANPT